MEFIISVLVFSCLCAIVYLVINSKSLIKAILSIGKKDISNSLSIKEKEKMIEEELKRRKVILDKIDNFLEKSQFIEPIAKWRNESIYRYILNEGVLYEFDDIMSENNQRIGMDDDLLCFKQLSYKRVNNPQDFYENLKSDIISKKNEERELIEKKLNELSVSI